jgi:RNA polymerase sigma factor (sigma-70 family)
MPSGHNGAVARAIGALFEAGAVSAWEDGALLDRFASHRDEEAFAVLVRRHGPRVMGVCRSILGDEHAAEDAFQATFLVLARRAGSLRNTARLGAWLNGVARKTARKARTKTFRRLAFERSAAVPEAATVAFDPEMAEVPTVVDEELRRLPEEYSRPVVLCCVEGRTTTEAALALGWPRGTVGTRLARARALLRSRLTRRGVVLSIPVSTALADRTARAAVSFASGPGAGGTVPPVAAALADGVLEGMFMTKTHIGMAVFLAAGVVAAGGSHLIARGPQNDPAGPPIGAPHDDNANDETILGLWTLSDVAVNGAESPTLADALRGTIWSIAPDGISVHTKVGRVEYAYTLDPAADPARIKTTPRNAAQGRPIAGIYAREGTTLKIGYRDGSDRYPNRLNAQPDDRQHPMILLTFKLLGPTPAVTPNDRIASTRSLKMIGLAMHNYASINGHFPAAATTSADGKPLLSWRVAILPFLEENPLYNQFHLNEPWDSAHNKALLSRMPATYAPRVGADLRKGLTAFQAFVGPGALFEEGKGSGFAEILDGTSNTMAVAETAKPVPWTKPDDLPFDRNAPLPKLGGELPAEGLLVLFADGSVRYFAGKALDDDIFRAAITRAGSEVVDINNLVVGPPRP